MRVCVLLGWLVAMAAGCGGPAPAAPDEGAAARNKAEPRILIISADGMRPDVLLRGQAPTIRGLMRRGAFTFWATTVDKAWTVPSHVSMLTGVRPEIHGMQDNWDTEPGAIPHPLAPTLFEVARKHGVTTGLAVGKWKLHVLAKPGTFDWSYIPKDYAPASQVAEEAAKMIRAHAPRLLFVHFPDLDAEGHASGWGTRQQVDAVARVDKATRVVLDALREKKLLDSTHILFTADHGGASIYHGAQDERSRRVPWIITGPGIRKDYDLTNDYYLEVRTYDTFATACHLLKLQTPPGTEGKPIRQIFEVPAATELLHPATRPAGAE